MNTNRTISAVVAGVALIASAGVATASSDTTDPPTSTEAQGTPASTITTEGSTSAAPPVIDPGDGGNYAPSIGPANFVDVVDNTYFPLIPGSRWVYEGESEGVAERIEVEVLPERRDIMGISAVVVRDTVYVEDELAEDTYDWYAQDTDGNVWYLGEETKEFDNGQTSDAGSWEYGVDGALPGIVMLANPTVGDAYRQEYWAGEAEDMGEVIEVGATVTIGLGDYTDVVVTQDWTPLEPDVIETKSYAPGVGVIHEADVAGGDEVVELIEFTPGS
jgi:hypothetical protein